MYRKLLTMIFILSVGVGSVYAQEDGESISKTQFEMRAYTACIQSCLDGLEKSPQNSNYLNTLARAYTKTQDLEKAMVTYEQLFELEPDHVPVIAQLEYAHVLKKSGDLDQANLWYHKYGNYDAAIGMHFASSCGVAKDLFQSDASFSVEPFQVNSSEDDFALRSIPGSFVMSSYRKDVKKEINLATLNSPGIYKISGPDATGLEHMSNLKIDGLDLINPAFVNYCQANEMWAITASGFEDGVQQFDEDLSDMKIYLCENEFGKSGTMNEFAFNKLGYSTGFPSFSADGKVMYFASNMPGGMGGFDIYHTTFEHGSWNTPVNLGAIINTSGNETCPEIAQNTLYFSSDHHPGLGGYDIFKTSVHNGIWQEVLNVGNGVNSYMDDIYPTFEESTGKIYFSSSRTGGQGGLDVYVASKIYTETVSQTQMIIPVAVNLDNLAVRNSDSEANTNVLANEVTTVSIIKNTINTEAIPSQNTTTDLFVVESSIISNHFSLEDATLVNVQKAPAKAPEKVYFIQVAAFSKSSGDVIPFMNLSHYGNLYKIHKSNSTKLRLGYYMSPTEAQEILFQVKQDGFKDAFIVMESLVSAELELVVSSKSSKSSTGKSNTSSTPTTQSSDMNSGKIFKIRLASYTDPLWFDTERVKDLGEIEQWTKGNYTIFILGGFHNLNEAQNAMVKAKNRGFTEAHIVVDNNGYLEKLKRN